MLKFIWGAVREALALGLVSDPCRAELEAVLARLERTRTVTEFRPWA